MPLWEGWLTGEDEQWIELCSAGSRVTRVFLPARFHAGRLQAFQRPPSPYDRRLVIFLLWRGAIWRTTMKTGCKCDRFVRSSLQRSGGRGGKRLGPADCNKDTHIFRVLSTYPPRLVSGYCEWETGQPPSTSCNPLEARYGRTFASTARAFSWNLHQELLIGATGPRPALVAPQHKGVDTHASS